MSVQLALTKGYEAVRYHFKTKANEAAFDKRQDRFFFKKLARHEDLIDFLVANLSEDPWVKPATLAYSVASERVYRDWKIRVKWLPQFIQTLGLTREDLDSTTGHPRIISRYLRGDLTLEALSCLTHAAGDPWLNSDDPVLKETGQKAAWVWQFLGQDETANRFLFTELFDTPSNPEV